MALTNCRECQKEISDSISVIKCPNCGVILPNGEFIKKTKGVFKGIAIFFGVMFFIAAFSESQNSVDRQQSDASAQVEDYESRALRLKKERDNLAQNAHYACRAFIRENATSKIELAGVADWRYEYSFDNDEYYTYSWIKGQNGFGAWIRQNYKCTTSWDADNEEWVNINVSFIE